MSDAIIETGPGFWNILGSFKIAKLIDIGTQCSLVRLASGKFVLLDSYTFDQHVESRIMELTDQGQSIEAILNLHPFHTVHVKATAARFPHAKLYGTARHIERAPDLNWEDLHTNDPALHDLFAEDFEFSIPRGVDFISDDEKIHFSSVLVIHRASQTLHVDDTLTWVDLPLVRGLRFHPTLSSALRKEPGASDAFRTWAYALIESCRNVKHLCAAHMRSPKHNPQENLSKAIHKALQNVEGTLEKHAQTYG